MQKITFSNSITGIFLFFLVFSGAVHATINDKSGNNILDNKNVSALSVSNAAQEMSCEIHLIQNTSADGVDDGSAEVTVVGGRAPYTFLWDNGETTQRAVQLSVGVRTVVVTDCDGKYTQCEIEILCSTAHEICDGIDNDGDGDIDEGFDADHDGVADCFDKCPEGDDHVDLDNDGIPDACDDDVCIQEPEPETACYEVATWNPDTCMWDISGEQPKEPDTECYEVATWNPHTCMWDIEDGQPEEPDTECYEVATWNPDTCEWDITGDQPEKPDTECYEVATWNPDTCEWDVSGHQPEKPDTECYEVATWNPDTCEWDVSGDQPAEPDTECYEVAIWNPDTCEWDIEDGQPEEPETACYEVATWNPDTCEWDVTGDQPAEPDTECYEVATWNPDTCEWDVTGDQPAEPDTECYEVATWNPDTCEWDVTGDQPAEPDTECYEVATWNPDTCEWDVTGDQPAEPDTECYEVATWNPDTCEWDVTGDQPAEPDTECYEVATWNPDTCEWDVTGDQPAEPDTECYEVATWNPDTCEWDVTGDQPAEPDTECYEVATWNPDTCEWDVTGDKPAEPETECYETAVWNENTCEWDIIEDDDKSCAGSIDSCETAFARLDSSDAICFEDIQGFNSPRWGWTNLMSTSVSNYTLDFYAAAGQCDISKGALIGEVSVSYANGEVDVTVTTVAGVDMTVAHLYVGAGILPIGNNGKPTVAPGQYPYQDSESGRFTSYTFEDIPVGDADTYYLILHAEVCPVGVDPDNDDDNAISTIDRKIEAKAFPVIFYDNVNVEIEVSYQTDCNISIFDITGRRVKNLGIYSLNRGKNNINLPVGDVAGGLHFIHINTGYEQKAIKIIGQ